MPWPNLDASTTSVLGGERDAAVIVALEEYTYVGAVPGAVDNGLSWQRYLTGALRVPVGRVTLLVNEQATRESVEAKLDWAAKEAQPGGRVWFVFIGHGSPSRTGRDGLLLGADAQANADSLESRSLRQGDVIRRLEASRAQPVLVLDACCSGRTLSAEPLCAGCQPITLAPVPTPERAVVLSAGKADQVAGPLPGRARPAFSYLALGALRGWGDGDRDGTVTANEVVTYANAAMGALVHGREQTAEVHGDADFPLAESAGEVGPDLAEIQRILSRSGAMEFNGDRLVLPDLPSPRLGARGTRGERSADLPRIDWADEQRKEAQYLAAATFQRKVEAAQASGRNDPRGVKQEKAWCELAALPDPNPHREEAAQACAKLRAYVEQRKRLVTAMRRDWNATVVPFTNLVHRSASAKRQVLRAFVRSYAMLADEGEVVRGREAIRELRRRRSPLLMPIGEQVRIAGGSFEWSYPDRAIKTEMVVPDFWLDKTEVTVGAYNICVAAGACHRLESWSWCNHERGGGARLPANCVDVSDAEGYCAWVGGRLPTEFEWEWAARGREKGWSFPWGEGEPEGRACVNRPRSCEVGEFPADATPEGVLDLIGNLQEWTSSRDGDPELRVARGGSYDGDHGPQPSARARDVFISDDEHVGFRCARSI